MWLVQVSTLPALQKTFVDFFFEFVWGFVIEKWRGFLVNFQVVSASQETKQKKKKTRKYRENSEQNSEKSKWGLSKWGLKVLVHNCPRLPTIAIILRWKLPLERGPKRPQKCTVVDDSAQNGREWP